MSRLLAARCLTDFDSSVSGVRAVSRALRGREFGALGLLPSSRLLADALAGLPEPVRLRLFVATGWQQGAPERLVRRLRAADLDEWVTSQYGAGPYPAMLVGAASGAAVHLCAALGAPFLPQTLLVGVRQSSVDIDEPRSAMAAFDRLGHHLVTANPDLQLHHMHDPNQDRPMLDRFGYFRFKRRRLGPVLERFCRQRLRPGGSIFVLDCRLRWPSTTLDDQRFFQFGALGGIPAEEYHDGSERISRFLAEQGATVRRWDPPPPDREAPEAEWGFEPALMDDVNLLAQRYGFRVRRVVVDHPEELSPPVADLFRDWYRRRGIPSDRLLVESYNQTEPLWALRLGAVPFWLHFTVTSAIERARHYLDTRGDPAEILVNLFSNGLCSLGQVPLDEWRALAARATRHGALVGVAEDAYPTDIGSTVRYAAALARHGPRHPLPPPLPLSIVDDFLPEER
ncbi:Acireductone dioxygenase (methionine salvage), cupin superfamily [Streptoalloteichus tenebrarius]|uniref:Acireductone dioxygenase (Methionine salvage), cupin superfamily n=1 Tax=Streptoalloteichus tenebrarius (strain ATCC 17920 / DSM 40477 / JCM 4838 / CBS 697.72 / NBRC 16177 / NCIMB 11028 / NRRL B-12390 / A12253. 1 / ISP 5477) TaxID=1933 RepID=A0ABT1HYQ7_STRSD|nr:hypothetical protein [Streptoalloteichus tenebrarius]MCP2260662.1 Acireductone dioxygenase (methionine salvage), cupin superfamily [Streptoalloteichus tenebrarius]BFF03808.1 hypothetical protein GCM10020241_54830 [Streptoalloteichus tenebrarius]